jgi:RHS repeat-associated protein
VVGDVLYEPDGLLTKIVYGDLAKTKADFKYNPSRRLDAYTLTRTTVAAWSTAAPNYPLPGPDTTQTDLLHLAYAYDPLGAPVRIEDLSAGAWPATNLPQRRRDIGYDAVGRLQSVATSYTTPSGDAPWQSPFQAEAAIAPNVLAPLFPLADAPSRPRLEKFGHDGWDTLTAADSDLNLSFDRSLTNVTLRPPADGPQRLDTAVGVQTAYDAAGNLIRLALDRSARCPTGGANASACDQWFAFDWDEIGQLARARRWDFTSAAARPSVITDLPAGAPTFDRRNRFSAGRRIWSALKSAGGADIYQIDVLPTLRLDGISITGGDYDVAEERVRVRLPGLVTAALDHEDRLPRLNPAGQLHLFIHLPDALGSHAITLDQGTGEIAERTTWTPFGATENDFRPARWGSIRALDRFAGKADDPELGLVNFGARFFSPYLMRFVSPDPHVQHAAVANANPYSYTHGRPFGRNDESGLVTSCGDGCYDFTDSHDP